MDIESMRLRILPQLQVRRRSASSDRRVYRPLQAYGRLRGAGCDEATALEQLGISRCTLYRWQPAPKSTRPPTGYCTQAVKALLDTRRGHPFMVRRSSMACSGAVASI